MNELLSSLIEMFSQEFDTPEVKREVLKPISKWLFANIVPYAIGMIFLNFFLTIAAVSLVLYIYKR